MAERILIVLPNWFGDTVFATPFLRAVRQAYPGCELDVLGWPQVQQVLLANPDVSTFIIFDEQGQDRGVGGKLRLITQLRARRYTISIILRKSLSRTLLLAAAGIPIRVGFANPKSGWLLTHRATPPDGLVHKAKALFALCDALGVAAAWQPTRYVVTDQERGIAASLLHDVSRRPRILLHPGANWLHKRWLPERFAAVGDRLAAQHGAAIVLTGGPEDRPLAEAIAGRMRQPCTTLAGRTTLRELAACLEQADLLISNDTGVLHIAAALNRPLVALYGPTSPALTGPLGAPQQTRVIHHPDCCPVIPCYAPERPPHLGMASISVDEVCEAAGWLLRAGHPSADAHG